MQSVHRTFRLIATDWLLLFGFYLLCAGKISRGEGIAGAIVGLLGAAALALLHRKRDHHLRTGFAPLARLPRVLLQMLKDCFTVLAAIPRRPFRHSGTGRFREREWSAGRLDPAGRGRRAVAMLTISAAPNTFVLAIDYSSNRMLVHELIPQPNDKPLS